MLRIQILNIPLHIVTWWKTFQIICVKLHIITNKIELNSNVPYCFNTNYHLLLLHNSSRLGKSSFFLKSSSQVSLVSKLVSSVGSVGVAVKFSKAVVGPL